MDRSKYITQLLGTLKMPQTKEDLDKVQADLRDPKRGIGTERKLDRSEIYRQAFNGANLVLWVMKMYNTKSKAESMKFSQHLLTKGIFTSLSHPNKVGGDFKDSPQSWYCFAEDEFDKYISSIPEEQIHYVHSLIIGPLGLRTTNDPGRPLYRSKLIGWLLKRFYDLKNRSEAARFLLVLVDKGLLFKEGDIFYYNGLAESTTISKDYIKTLEKNIPLEICGICKHFTAVLSIEPVVSLSCGHSFHRACLSTLQYDEMGRCSDCDSNVSTIKTNTELDLIFPFIIKILGTPNYKFKQRIDDFVLSFNQTFIKKNPEKVDEKTLTEALETASDFIFEMNNDVLADLKLLRQFEQGTQKTLLIIKKHILPQVYGSLFPVFVKVNKEKDRILNEKIKTLQSVATPEFMDIKPKFRLTNARPTPSSSSSVTSTPNPSNPTKTAPPPFPSPMLIRPESRKGTPAPSTRGRDPEESDGELSMSNGNGSNIQLTSSPGTPVPSGGSSPFLPGENKGEGSSPSPYMLAIMEFDRLLDYTDIYDKLNCLLLTRHYIETAIVNFWKSKANFNPDDLTMDTDQLVLILSYVIVKSQVTNLFAELQYMDEFIDDFFLKGEFGYYLIIFQTALDYIAHLNISKE